MHVSSKHGPSKPSKIPSSQEDLTAPPPLVGSDGVSKLPYDPLFLRDCCPCSRCVDPSTRQKLFATAAIPKEISVKNMESFSDGSFKISWRNDIPRFGDNHESEYGADFAPSTAFRRARLQRSYYIERPPVPWDKTSIEATSLRHSYDDFMKSDRGLLLVLRQLTEYGLAFLSGVPSDPVSVKAIGNRVGPLRNTFYGETWDVRSVPAAKNVAYTSQDLGFHMDLLYMAEPPGLQLLHCMKASASGGESLFSDTVRALRETPSEYLLPLYEFPVTFRYKNDGHWYQFSRPTLETHFITYGVKTPEQARHHLKDIYAVNWSPPFQGPFEIDIGEQLDRNNISHLRHYVNSAAEFQKALEDEAGIYETRMDGGTCVIFDNRRTVHARKAFEGEGEERWLRGAYIDMDVFKSRYRVLSDMHGGPEEKLTPKLHSSGYREGKR